MHYSIVSNAIKLIICLTIYLIKKKKNNYINAKMFYFCRNLKVYLKMHNFNYSIFYKTSFKCIWKLEFLSTERKIRNVLSYMLEMFYNIY